MMAKRDGLIEASVIGLGAGAAGALIGVAVSMGIDPEAIFAAAGALVGAALTVMGAIWIADRNRNAELTEEVEILAKDYDKLIESADKAQKLEPADGGLWSAEYRDALHEFGWKTRGSRLITEQAIERSRALNFRQIASLRDFLTMLRFAEGFYDDCFESHEELHPMDERSWPVMVRDVIERTRETIGHLQHR